jgi:hypothetical protein
MLASPFFSAETWQAQNDAAAAAAVGGGLEETLMGVEEYGACFFGDVFIVFYVLSFSDTTGNSPCYFGAILICLVKSNKTCAKQRLLSKQLTTDSIKSSNSGGIYFVSSRLCFASAAAPPPCSRLLHDLTRSTSLASLSRL